MSDCMVKLVIDSNKKSPEYKESGIPINKTEKCSVKFDYWGALCVEEPFNGSSWNFRFFPFVAGMMIYYDSKNIERGCCYQFSGDKLGELSLGHIGHPGDQEYESYVVKKLDIRISYSPEQITIMLKGQTEEGKMCIGKHNGWTTDLQYFQYPDLNFTMKIYIPINETLQELLKMRDDIFIDFKKRFNQACNSIQ